MSLLLEKQMLHGECLARLLPFILSHPGFKFTLEDGYRPDGQGHKKNSNHYIKLAQDINLFKDGVFLKDSLDHAPFGAFWESLSPECVWGGRWGDGNHYAVEYMGRK